MIDAHLRGDNAEALRIYQQLLPIYTGIFRTAGTILVKAGLRLLAETGMDADLAAGLERAGALAPARRHARADRAVAAGSGRGRPALTRGQHEPGLIAGRHTDCQSRRPLRMT